METILVFIWDLLLQHTGQAIRWIFFLGRKKYKELEDSHYNYLLSISFYILIGITLAKFGEF